jgi:hypothetical protein
MILKSEKPPTAGAGSDQYELGDQSRAAKALGLDAPPTLMRADEVI